MPHFICVTCGVQYTESDSPPALCPICSDERQYVNADGQQWTTLENLRDGHSNRFDPVEPGVTRITSEPQIAIGQSAHLIQTSEGNILWDCITLVDDATVERINSMGGLKAITLSHPHFYSTTAEWSRAFGNVPVYLPRADHQWVMRPHDNIVFWDGDRLPLFGGATVIRCGGHFEGSSVLHWPGEDGNGVLFTGDTIYIAADTRWVTFMYSYPNLIPLNAAGVMGIVNAVKPYAFERLYMAFRKVVSPDAHGTVIRSAERYLNAIRTA